MMVRVFPSFRKNAAVLLRDIGLDVRSEPYPADRLKYKNSKLVEYETAGGAQGLGTRHLKQDSEPIEGVAIITGAELNLVHASVRLPVNLRSLSSIIIHQVENDVAHKKFGQ